VSATTSVVVDRDFARFGSKSYAINKINSVDVRRRHPHGQGFMLLWGLLCLAPSVVVLTDITNRTLSGNTVLMVVLAGFFGFLAYRAWQKSRLVEYQLFLTTSSQEAQAIASMDRDFIVALRGKIETAMAGRGD
jgi:uncharacterized PurR-regulated membrane protein YhhQ (DUF165 family)